MWNEKYRLELEQKRAAARQGGGPKRIDKQHQAGKLTAAERIELLFDKGSFHELEDLSCARGDDRGMEGKRFPGDGVIVGIGQIFGRDVAAAVQDFTVNGGTLGETHARKICRIMDMAMKLRIPYISINDSGGARIEEGITALDGYSAIFYRNVRASGIIPQISVILGTCAGGACYSPAITDFVFISRRSGYMFITGPKVVKAVMSEEISPAELGGADIHAARSGVAQFVYEDDRQTLEAVRCLLSYLPANNEELPPVTEEIPAAPAALEELVPDNQRQVYDIRPVIRALIQKDSFMEVSPGYAGNIVVGFARIGGETVGVVANQPMVMGGTLDSASSEKAARFIRFCDCFSIPLLTLVDVPGFMPGREQEHGGIIRRGAKLLYAYAEATVPKVTLILRKAFGGAYIAMNSKSMGADVVYAWPIAQTAVMGAEGAVDILHGKELAALPDEERRTARNRYIEEYEDYYMNPYIAAERGYIDEVILPEESAERIAAAFASLRMKERLDPGRRHGNIPL